MSHDARRAAVADKARERGLAEPVAQLIAAAYEPRLDADAPSPDFDAAVAVAKSDLRRALAEVTMTEGGRAESVALRVAKILRKQAEDSGASSAVQLIDEALDRCRHGISATTPDEQQAVLIEPERVLSRSGRPIGLWR